MYRNNRRNATYTGNQQNARVCVCVCVCVTKSGGRGAAERSTTAVAQERPGPPQTVSPTQSDTECPADNIAVAQAEDNIEKRRHGGTQGGGGGGGGRAGCAAPPPAARAARPCRKGRAEAGTGRAARARACIPSGGTTCGRACMHGGGARRGCTGAVQIAQVAAPLSFFFLAQGAAQRSRVQRRRGTAAGRRWLRREKERGCRSGG